MERKPKPSKEELQARYNELRSVAKVGEYYKVSDATACNWLKKDGIKTNDLTKHISPEKKPSKEEFKRKCEEFKYNLKKIKIYYRISISTAWSWTKKWEIKTNKSNRQISKEKKPPKKELETKCEELKYNIRKVAKYYEVSNNTAWSWMKKDRIKRNKSTRQISKEKKPSREEFEAKCKELRYSSVKVGKYYKVCQPTAWDWMKEYGIMTNKKRQNSLESMIRTYIGAAQ